MPYKDPAVRREKHRARRARVRNQIQECECGLPKTAKQIACDRCEYLDGKHPREQEIIGSLREHGPLTLNQLAQEIECDHRVVRLTLQRMVERGRIRPHYEAAGGQNQAHLYSLTEHT